MSILERPTTSFDDTLGTPKNGLTVKRSVGDLNDKNGVAGIRDCSGAQGTGKIGANSDFLFSNTWPVEKLAYQLIEIPVGEAEYMSGGVLAWCASNGQQGGHLDPTTSTVPISDEEMLRVRHLAAGLADAGQS